MHLRGDDLQAEEDTDFLITQVIILPTNLNEHATLMLVAKMIMLSCGNDPKVQFEVDGSFTNSHFFTVADMLMMLSEMKQRCLRNFFVELSQKRRLPCHLHKTFILQLHKFRRFVLCVFKTLFVFNRFQLCKICFRMITLRSV